MKKTKMTGVEISTDEVARFVFMAVEATFKMKKSLMNADTRGLVKYVLNNSLDSLLPVIQEELEYWASVLGSGKA